MAGDERPKMPPPMLEAPPCLPSSVPDILEGLDEETIPSPVAAEPSYDVPAGWSLTGVVGSLGSTHPTTCVVSNTGSVSASASPPAMPPVRQESESASNVVGGSSSGEKEKLGSPVAAQLMPRSMSMDKVGPTSSLGQGVNGNVSPTGSTRQPWTLSPTKSPSGGDRGRLNVPSTRSFSGLVDPLHEEATLLKQEVAEHNKRLVKSLSRRIDAMLAHHNTATAAAVAAAASANSNSSNTHNNSNIINNNHINSGSGEHAPTTRLSSRSSWGVWSPRGVAGGTASFLDMVSGRARTIRTPDSLTLAVPPNLKECGGQYVISPGLVHNFLPTWKQVGGARLLYSTAGGHWAVGPELDNAICTSIVAHGGQMPDKQNLIWEAHAESAELLFPHVRKPADLQSTLRDLARTPPTRNRLELSGQLSLRGTQDLRNAIRFEASNNSSTAREERRSFWGSVERRLSMWEPDEPAKSKGKQKSPGVFANTDKLKANLARELLAVEDRTHDTFLQRVMKSQLFESLTLVVIMCNAIWIGYDAETNKAATLPEAPPGYQIMEHLFCSFFTVEILLRFITFNNRQEAIYNKSFLFDGILVLLMVVETWVIYFIPMTETNTGSLSVLRVLRLSRMGRMVRLVRAVPELMIIIKGVSVASRSVIWTLSLMLVIIYVFAVAFYILTDGLPVGDVYFKTVPDSMVFLLLPGLLPDMADPMYRLAEQHIFFSALFMLFIIVGTITIMNMLVGVMVEGVNAVAVLEKEAFNLNYVKQEMTGLLQSVGKAPSDSLTRDDMKLILLCEKGVQVAQKVGVDIEGLAEIAEFQLFKNGNSTTFSGLVDLVLQMRGTNTATVRDIMNLRKFIVDELSALGLKPSFNNSYEATREVDLDDSENEDETLV